MFLFDVCLLFIFMFSFLPHVYTSRLLWCVVAIFVIYRCDLLNISSDLPTIYGIICRPNHIWSSYTGFQIICGNGFQIIYGPHMIICGRHMISELNHIWDHIPTRISNHMSNHIWFENGIWFECQIIYGLIKSYMIPIYEPFSSSISPLLVQII